MRHPVKSNSRYDPAMSSNLTPTELIRRAGFAVNTPASEEAISELEAVWEIELPAELRALYLDHDGQPFPEHEEVTTPFRLLPIVEALAAHEEMTLDVPLLDDLPDLQEGIVLLWGDVGGNFMAYFLKGARRGMVGELHHEIPWSIAPKWRSVSSFYAAMIAAAHDKKGRYPTDFPHLGQADEQQLAAFAEAQAALTGAQTAYEYDYWSAHLLQLCPPGEALTLLPLLTPLLEEGSYASTHVLPAAERLVGELGAEAMPYLREALVSNVERGIFKPEIVRPLLEALAQHPQPATAKLLRNLVARHRLTKEVHHSLFAFSLADTLKAHGYTQEAVKDEAGELVGLHLSAADADPIRIDFLKG